MNSRVSSVVISALIICVCLIATSTTARAQTRIYQVVEVDRFNSESGVKFPLDYQVALVEDIIRDAMRTSKTLEIAREGENINRPEDALRITGTIIRFKPGSRAKRYLIGFGVGSTIVKAHVTFVDLASGRPVLEREVQGTTWGGLLGGSSDSADDQLGSKIVALAKKNHLISGK
jgi:hypothetical protein